MLCMKAAMSCTKPVPCSTWYQMLQWITLAIPLIFIAKIIIIIVIIVFAINFFTTKSVDD